MTSAQAAAVCSLLAAGSALAACATVPGVPSPQARLAGAPWRLVEFRSSDDAIGVLRPDDPAKYEMRLSPDGTLVLRLDCNRGSGRWAAPAGDGNSGSISFRPVAMTRAACPPGSLDTRIARDLGYVRSYVLRGDELHLSLMADGGIYTWRRITP